MEEYAQWWYMMTSGMRVLEYSKSVPRLAVWALVLIQGAICFVHIITPVPMVHSAPAAAKECATVLSNSLAGDTAGDINDEGSEGIGTSMMSLHEL